MPSLIRLLAPDGFERRRSPRYLVPPNSTLVVGVAVLDGGGKSHSFTGRARDVSRTGLAALLPPDETCGELVGDCRSLITVVSLPTGVIRFRASPAYCHPLDADQPRRGYVVGLHITEIGEHDQSLLDEYLRELEIANQP
jgi:hypothetical protein